MRQLTYLSVALDFHMAIRGYSPRSTSLAAEIDATIRRSAQPSTKPICRTLHSWRTGQMYPRKHESFVLLRKVETRFGLPAGYFANLDNTLTPTERAVRMVNAREQAMLRWHLPDDFDRRSEAKRAEILAWATQNILPCGTDFGKYLSRASRKHFSVVFPQMPRELGGRLGDGMTLRRQLAKGKSGTYGTTTAPARLAAEMGDLVAFKTASIAPPGYKRYLRWSQHSAKAAVTRYGQMFGAFTSAPLSFRSGYGLPAEKLSFGLLVFPAIWDWYLHWCEKRRGFFSVSERSMLYEAKALTRRVTGWLRQHPELANRLEPIPGIVSVDDIRDAQSNWDSVCDTCFQHVCDRIKELLPIVRVHRDPFAAILPVLTAKSPLREYRKIADEIAKRIPGQPPRETAVTVRSYLLFRLAVHSGLRQRNLRELLVCDRGQKQTELRELEDRRCGELRWNSADRRWEMFIPAIAFKNGSGSFFRGRPFQMTLPNLRDLYHWIGAYLHQHRPLLLSGAPDPRTFFVRDMYRSDARNPEFEIYAFYDCWKHMIQKYGIYNPYTRRGAIKGILPHGPHCVRDILATHLLKQTGSYELASFAIQDSMEAVMRHYARFLPHEKTARAAEELNKVWI